MAGEILFCGPAWAQSGYTVVSGSFAVSTDTNLGPPTSTLTLDEGTTLKFLGSLTFDHLIVLMGDPVFDVPPGQTVTIATPITAGGTPSTDVKTDGGTLILAAQNTYTGATTIQGGTLAIGNGGAIATSSGVGLTAAGTIFDITSAGNQTIGDLSGGFGSSVTLGANTLTFGTANATIFGGVISGTGGITKQGSGTLTLAERQQHPYRRDLDRRRHAGDRRRRVGRACRAGSISRPRGDRVRYLGGRQPDDPAISVASLAPVR